MAIDVFENLNEDTFPVISLIALAFIVVMGIAYGATMLMHVTTDTGEEEIPFDLFGMFNAWVIIIVSIILIMIIIIGFTIVKKHT